MIYHDCYGNAIVIQKVLSWCFCCVIIERTRVIKIKIDMMLNVVLPCSSSRVFPYCTLPGWVSSMAAPCSIWCQVAMVSLSLRHIP